jgi:CRISPR/Cas system-associated exonuclease Cas4 (RecB family)
MPSVSHSEVDSYLLCRRKHYYGYGLSLQRVTTSSSLATGTAIHQIADAFYSAILAAGNTIQLQQAAIGDAIKAAKVKLDEIMVDFEQDEKRVSLEELFFTWYLPNEPFISNGWRILASEKKFNLQYDENEAGDPLTYPFVIDLIVRDPEGKTVVVDHKAVWDFYTDADAELQPQIPKYIAGLRALNFKVDYGMYNMLRTRLIRGAKKNKAELVEAVSAKCADPESDYDKPVSRFTVVELEQMASDMDIQVYAGPDLDQMLLTKRLDIPTPRIVQTFKEQIAVAKEVQALKTLPIEEQDARAYRTANKMVCNSCSFRDLCTTELMGNNTKLMIATEFQVRERIAFVEVSEDA